MDNNASSIEQRNVFLYEKEKDDLRIEAMYVMFILIFCLCFFTICQTGFKQFKPSWS